MGLSPWASSLGSSLGSIRGSVCCLLIPMFSYFSSVFWTDPLYKKERAECGLEAGQKRVQTRVGLVLCACECVCVCVCMGREGPWHGLTLRGELCLEALRRRPGWSERQFAV